MEGFFGADNNRGIGTTERAVVQYTHDCELCILQLNGITHGQGVAFVEYRQHRVCAILRLLRKGSANQVFFRPAKLYRIV